jgi:phosphate transport system permease protein
VLIADAVARTLITIGGLGTIVAVLTVCLFLILTVKDLFFGARLHQAAVRRAASPSELPPTHIGWHDDSGSFIATDRAGRHALYRAEEPAISPADEPGITPIPMPADPARRLERTGAGVLRLVQPEVTPDPTAPKLTRKTVAEIKLPADHSPSLRSGDFLALKTRSVAVTIDDRGAVTLWSAKIRTGLGGRPVKGPPPPATGMSLPLPAGFTPTFALLGEEARVLWLISTNGRLVRFDTRDPAKPTLAEEFRLTGAPADEVTVTAAALLPGRGSLLIGDRNGTVRVWFLTRPEGASTGDGSLGVEARRLELGAPVVALAASADSRLVAAVDSTNRVTLWHATSERKVAEWTSDSTIAALSIAEKDRGLAVANEGGLHFLRLGPSKPTGVGLLDPVGLHPEISWKVLFGKVWYEGYQKPDYVWQTSGNEGGEAKFSFIPLIFGTLKATLYGMLFGAPIAFMAALYTSQFLHPKLKARIKPTIELMASLPSVVLGLIGGLVIAPIAARLLPAVLTGIFLVPFLLILGGHIWRFLPRRLTLGNGGWRLAAILVIIPLAGWLSLVVGPLVEDVLFGGDIVRWLNDRDPARKTSIGAFGGWLILMLPAALVIVLLLEGSGRLPTLGGNPTSRRGAALQSLIRFLVLVAVAVALAVVVSGGLGAIRDPRGLAFDTYDSRNALIVGFIMGFAIIPIIFTVADDALTAVPEHLRAASLGAGATPWQTAVRVVVPTAMGGLFSALMIGLGRAVGETMIVVMATGNTPIMDWNIFSGFATLSARIATEIREAPVGGTHYRLLFLAGLVLFVMTFCLNTAAEVVRRRFRQRTSEL